MHVLFCFIWCELTFHLIFSRLKHVRMENRFWFCVLYHRIEHSVSFRCISINHCMIKLLGVIPFFICNVISIKVCLILFVIFNFWYFSWSNCITNLKKRNKWKFFAYMCIYEKKLCHELINLFKISLTFSVILINL